MNAHPYRTALLLALATILGLVGLMVLEGWWQVPFFGMAALPAACGAFAYLRVGRCR